MALIKQKFIKGIPCDYWKLTSISADILHNMTTISLAIYFSRDARLQNCENVQDYVSILAEGVDYTVESAYRKVKESKIGHDSVGGAIVEVQKNWFFDAIDLFEEGQSGYISPVKKPVQEKKMAKPKRRKAEKM